MTACRWPWVAQANTRLTHRYVEQADVELGLGPKRTGVGLRRGSSRPAFMSRPPVERVTLPPRKTTVRNEVTARPLFAKVEGEAGITRMRTGGGMTQEARLG